MVYEWNELGLTIKLPERIDTNNSADVGEKIDEIIHEREVISLVLDADELNYISSAGLRLILKLVKTIRNVRMINVSSDVFDIFELSGFSNIISIEKK